MWQHHSTAAADTISARRHEGEEKQGNTAGGASRSVSGSTQRPSSESPNRYLPFYLPFRLDVELLLFAPEFRRGFPFELVSVDLQREIERELVIHELPHSGKRQCVVL